MTALTRGPLPARVYWIRRVLAVAVLVALVLGCAQLARLAAGGSSRGPDRAAPMAAEPSAQPSEPPFAATPGEAGARDEHTGKRRDKGTPREPVLAEPDGECLDSDIAVTPTVEEAVGGGPITFVLELRTTGSDACTWQVSPQSVTMKITSGKDDIWSSLECPRAIPKEDVVVRDDVSTEVEVTWSARRSDDGCTLNTEWALPGWYWVKAAALAGEPSDLHFEVTAPEPRDETARAGQGRGKGKNKRQDEKKTEADRTRDGRDHDRRPRG